MADIELFFGNVTTRGAGSLNVVALYKQTSAAKAQPVASAVMDSKSGVRSLGLVDIKPSSKNNRPGQWTKTRVAFPEHSYLEMQFMRSGGSSGVFGATHALVLRLRQDGPLQRLVIELPMDEQVTESRGYVEGRFDIVTVKEIAALNVNCLRQIESYDPEDYEDFISVELLEKEFRPRAVIKQSPVKAQSTGTPAADGEKKVLRVRRIRRLNAGR